MPYAVISRTADPIVKFCQSNFHQPRVISCHSLTQWITIVAADDKAFHEPLGQRIAQVPKPKQRFVMEMLDTVL